MTMPTSLFESHLKYLKEHGYTVIPLRELVEFRLGRGPTPRPKSVVIVEDDAHRSVYTDMFPLVRKYQVPVTVFSYPSAVSNAKYAMTWDQLRELKRSGLFDVQAHTYWHPNFKVERKRLSPEEYGRFVDLQLGKARAKLEKELGGTVDLLAWPFGICDGDLPARAAAAGYRAAFSIVARPVTLADDPMALPRYMLSAADRESAFARIVAEADPRVTDRQPRAPRG
ncbi:MAG: polysaccharide deacetylase family protein [Deltaproteobacteria bacterium]|nr:polysaccharide deacetylase family protein [Deltaproteobacteria bacterium]